MMTFYFSNSSKDLISREFDGPHRYSEAEKFAEDNGYHYYHPHEYPTEEAARKRMEEYGDTKYTFATCPHLYCRDCKFFGVNCKRVDHRGVKFHKPPFSSYFHGENSIPCHDFEPSNPGWASYRDWKSLDDIWPVYVDTWLGGRIPKYQTFHLGEDFTYDYEVPFDLFFHGGMIEEGVLRAVHKKYYVRDKVDLGVQLYKIKTEEIGGVVIETGKTLPAENDSRKKGEKQQ